MRRQLINILPSPKKVLLEILLVLIFLCGYNFPQGREYLIKAAYIEKIARFIEWPEGAIDEKFIITIIGKNPFEDALDELAKKYSVKNLPVEINYISDIKELDRCNILFIAQSRKNSLNEIMNHIRNKPVLTIGESKGYGERGVNINFYITEEGTVHFEINNLSLKKAGLKIDMYLLELGKIVGG